MYIQTEETPNPNVLKFIPDEMVLPQGKTASFTNESEASSSPLAIALFAVENVEGVFLAHDFISITKKDETKWQHLKPHLVSCIMDFFVAGIAPVIYEDEPKNTGDRGDKGDRSDKSDNSANATEGTNAEDVAEIEAEIKELIEFRVRPAVAQDGGDIVFVEFKEGVVYLELHGACSGCPSSIYTLKNGIENMLKHYIPEVESVEAING